MWVKVGRQGRVYFRSVGLTDCNFPLGFLFFFKLDGASRESQAAVQMKEITAECIQENHSLYHHHHYRERCKFRAVSPVRCTSFAFK